MKIAVHDRYGPPEVVRIEEVERPTPVDDQVLVRVRAASVNRADLDGLGPKPGFLRLFLGLRAPRRKVRDGSDVAGTVEAVGPAAKRFQPGDAVYGDLWSHGQGAFAEFACAPERAFRPLPAGLSFEEASTLPHSAVLAIQGLRLRGGRTPQPGAKVLIDGASGCVGPFAIQVAKAMGLEVTGVASASKLDLVRGLGADQVIDYRAVDYTRTSERYDWIVDVDSHHSLFAARRSLRPNGAYVTLGGTTASIFGGLIVGPLISRFSDRWSGLMLWWKPWHAADVDRLEGLIAEGKLRPAIDRTYPLDEVVAALRHLHEGRARGKVVITLPAPAA
jgi:NADPH:quinone reductase-like Zn-dependent oxidoreductase